MKKIIFPLKNEEDIRKLKVGDEVLISGKILTARDHAHKKLVEIIGKEEKLPVDLKGALIYYAGPSPTPEGKIVGSIGPTTSKRMDRLTIPLLKFGLKATMGKGERSDEIVNLFKEYKVVYFITYGGCGAYLSQFVKEIKVLCFEELGPEAIYQLCIKDFPAIVGIDIYGNDFFKRKV
jgi:fumarate hydratase subunit beta